MRCENLNYSLLEELAPSGVDINLHMGKKRTGALVFCLD